MRNAPSRGARALALAALLAGACAPDEPKPPPQDSDQRGDAGPVGGNPGGGGVITPADGGNPAPDAAGPDDAGPITLDVSDRSETGVRDASGASDGTPFPPDNAGSPPDAFGAPDR